MSGMDGRTKGKRFRKPQSGGSNVKERWKYLSAQTDDVVHHSSGSSDGARHASRTTTADGTALVKRQQHPRATATTAAVTAPVQLGFDIDGDGQIDVREMRLAKFLDAMVGERQRQRAEQHAQRGSDPLPTMTESELTHMRQQAGRLLIAKEFIERNHDRLWRYGSVFTDKSEQQSAEFIASHKNFQKLMPFLENLERKRTIRSSQNLRECVQSDVSGVSGSDSGEQRHRNAQEDARLVRQTWIETSRKVPDAGFSTHPLPTLLPDKRVSFTELHPVTEPAAEFSSSVATRPDVRFNAYGAIDVDGDGIVDDDEMKLNLRLQEATLGDRSGNNPRRDDGSNYIRHHHFDNNNSSSSIQARETRQMQQLEGRHMMARDFVERNVDQLWLYEPRYRDLSPDEVVHEIASSSRFAKEINRLRAKERVLRLKSSSGVSNCLVQLPTTEQPADPFQAMEFRRVRHRSELLLARRELLKPPEVLASMAQQQQRAHPGAPRLRAVREDRRELSPTTSDTQVVGLPRIFETPVRIEATGSFSVTKWKFGD